MGGGDIETKLLHQPGEPRCLSFGQVQNEPREGRRVDDRMGQRAFQPPTHQPCVEGIVAVLDQDGTVRETKEGPARVTKLRRADQHRPVYVMSFFGVRVNGCAAIDERVEKRKWARQLESLGAELEHQKGCVTGRLDIDGDELRLVQPGLRTEVRRIDCDLLPGHRFRGAPGLQEERLHDCRLRADRTNSISSRVRALNMIAAAT